MPFYYKQMKKETLEKIKKGREDSQPVKLFKVAGWEVWMDSRNYITRRNGKEYYFSTLSKAVINCANENGKDYLKSKECKSVEDAAHLLELNYDFFLDQLNKALKGLKLPF